MFLGRDNELRQLRDLLARATEGESGALVIVGEPGIGKTSLLDAAVAGAGEMRVLRTRGFESESELAFSGLFDLLRPLEPAFSSLRGSQQAALESALGLAQAGGTDPLSVCAAVLELLATVAVQEPLLIVADDYQWLDRPSCGVLGFLCHHLGAESVALLIGTRSEDGSPVDGVDSLRLEGIPGDTAAELAREAGASGDGVAENVARLSGGNPLVVIELCGSLTADQLRGQEPVVEPIVAGDWAGQAFGRQIGSLPEDARRALVISAAAGTPEMTVIGRALAAAGVGVDDLGEAEKAGLVALTPNAVEFRHPLVRSAAYHLASPTERRAAHSAVAAALTDPERVDERAWHLAAAAVEPDEVVAEMMEDAAGRAAARGGYATAARALERAAGLTPAPPAQSRLLVAAAEAAERFGDTDTALALLDRADLTPESAPAVARGHLLRGRIEARTGSTGRAYELMVAAADAFEPLDPAASALALVESVDPCIRSGRPGLALETAHRATAVATSADGPASLYAQVAVAAATIFTGGAGEGSRLVSEVADTVLGSSELTHDLQLRAYVGMTLAFAEQWQPARSVLGDVVLDCQRRAPAMLPYPLVALGWLDRGTGDWGTAVTNLEIAVQRAAETGRANDEAWGLSVLTWIRAAQGREHDLDRLEWLNHELELPYQTLVVAAARGMLALGRGDGAGAVQPLREALADKHRYGFCDATTHPAIAPDLIEALVRSGLPDEARLELDRFEPDTDRPWARGQLYRARALLADDDDAADELFEAAVALHGAASDRFGAARTLLCHGERLRRSGQRKRSRERFAEAGETFADLSAASWLERCEQQVTRSAPQLRSGDAARDELTPTEHQVAGLVCQGLGNRVIGQRLFMSEKTVESHLTRTYRKLGAASRFELMQVYTPLD